MASYALRRLLLLVPLLWGLATATFVVLRVVPGDPVLLLAGDTASKQDLQVLRAHFGLDRPLFQQYLNFLGGIVSGHLGTSLRTRAPVAAELAQRLPHTLELALVATVWGCLLGLAIGALAAWRANGALDR